MYDKNLISYRHRTLLDMSLKQKKIHEKKNHEKKKCKRRFLTAYLNKNNIIIYN